MRSAIPLLFFFLCSALHAKDKDRAFLYGKIADCMKRGDSLCVCKSHFNLGVGDQMTGKPDSALAHYRRAIAFCPVKKDHLLVGKIYQNLSLLYSGNITDSALYFARLSLHHRQLLKDPMETSDAYNQIAYVEAELGHYEKALEAHLIALKYPEERKDTARLINTYNNLALVYSNMGEPKLVMDYYRKTMAFLLPGNNKKRLSGCSMNLANHFLSLNEIDSAMHYYSYALTLAEECGEREMTGECYFNLADMFFRQRRCEKAEPLIRRSIAILNELDPVTSKVYGSRLYGSILNCLGKTSEAEKYLMESYDESKRLALLPEINRITNILSAFHAKKGDYVKAFRFKEEFSATVDSLFTLEKVAEAKKLEKRYEMEKKEKEILELRSAEAMHMKELELSRIQKRDQFIISILVGGVLILVLVFAVILSKRLRITRAQKMTIEEQKKLVEEKQKEVMESIEYAKRIQLTQIPSEKRVGNLLEKWRKPD